MESKASADLGREYSAMHKLQESVFGLSTEKPSEALSGSVAEHISRVLVEMARRKKDGDTELEEADVSAYVERISR